MTRNVAGCTLLLLLLGSQGVQAVAPGDHPPTASTLSVDEAGTRIKIGSAATCWQPSEAFLAIVESPTPGQVGAWLGLPGLSECGPVAIPVQSSEEKATLAGVSLISEGSPADGTWGLTLLTTPHAGLLGRRVELGIRTSGGSQWWGFCGSTPSLGGPIRFFKNHNEATFDASASACPGVPPLELVETQSWFYHPVNILSPTDFDGDGAPNTGETSCGSRPDKPASTCLTDDDGDGTPNQAEAFFQGEREPCTGSYGWIQGPSPVFVAGCGGYALPPGWAGHDTVYVDQTTTPRRIWVHDGLCVPAGLANYQPCKASSNYALNPASYQGDYRSDGYGWRMAAIVGILQPVTVEAVEPCNGSPSDADQDLVWQVHVCKRRYTVDSQGTVTPAPNPSPFLGPLGDPDDANNQVPIPTLMVLDSDGDGSPSGEEVPAGSHPSTAQSAPTTDDDGDGHTNAAESEPRFLHSGAYGFLLDHPHYAKPPGWTPGNSVFVKTANGDLWTWDGVCTPALQFNYQGCRATGNPLANPTLYAGDVIQDGYGWRNHGSVGIEKTFPTFEPCAGYPRDQDADGVPQVAVRRRDVTVRSDGTFTFSAQQPFVEGLGDARDDDPDQPVPFEIVHETRKEAEAIVRNTLEDLNETLAQVAGLVEDLVNETKDAANDLLDQAQDLAASLEDFVNQTRDAGLELVASAQEDAQQVQAMAECAQRATGNYTTRVNTAAQTYLGDPSETNRHGLQDALVLGGLLYFGDLGGCDAVGVVAQFIVHTFEATAEAVVAFANALNETLANSPDPLGLVVDVLGEAGDGFDTITATLVDSLESLRVQVVNFAVASADAAGEAVVDASERDWAAVVAGLAEDSATPQGRARFEFHVTQASEQPVVGAHVELFQGDVRVASGNTSADGRLVVLVAANETFRYVVNHDGFEGAQGIVESGAAGSITPVGVLLTARFDVFSSAALPFGLGVALLLVGVVIGMAVRRHRR